MAGGHAQGFLPVLHHTDVAAFDLFLNLDLHDTAFLQLLFHKLPGDEAYAQALPDDGNHEIRRGKLDIRFQDQAVGGVKFLIEGISHCVFREGDKGVLLDLGEGNFFPFEIGVIVASGQNILTFLYQSDPEMGILPDGGSHYGKVGLTGFQICQCIGRGAAGELQADAGVLPVKRGELFEKKAVEGGLRDADVDGTVLITEGSADIFLTFKDLLAGGSYIFIELFSLAVRETPRLVRTKSRQPSSVSRACIQRETEGWLESRALAARVKFWYFAT